MCDHLVQFIGRVGHPSFTGPWFPGQMVISNPDLVVPCLEALSAAELDDVHVVVLERLEGIASQRVRNQMLLREGRVVEHLLAAIGPAVGPRLVRKKVDLLCILCCWHCSEAHLRRILMLLRPDLNGQKWPEYTIAMLHALCVMTRDVGPSNFFDLDVAVASIELEPVAKLPFGKAYSLALWLRFEELPSQLDTAKDPWGYTIVRMLNNLENPSKSGGRTPGIRLSFDDGGLLLLLDAKARAPVVQRLPFAFQNGRWYHVVVCQRRGDTFAKLVGGNRSNATLFVNGQLEFETPLEFPATMKPHVPIMIGEHSSSGRLDYRSCSLQLGAFQLFSTALAIDDVDALWRFGASPLTRANGSTDIFALSSKCVRELVPLTGSEHMYTDSSVVSVEGLHWTDKINFHPAPSVSRYPKIEGRVLFGHRRKIQDSIRCVGGVAVLLPFLSKLDCPIEKPAPPSAHDSDDGVVHGTDVGGAVLSFVSECFRSRANCEDAVESQLISVLQHLLLETCASSLSALMLAAVWQLTDFSQAEAQEQLLVHVIFNFSIWTQADYAVMLALAEEILRRALTNGVFVEMSRRLVGIHGMLDSVSRYLAPSSATIESTCFGQRRPYSEQQCKSLRVLVLGTVIELAGAEWANDDVNILMQLLQRHVEMPEVAVDLLNMVHIALPCVPCSSPRAVWKPSC